MSLKKVVFFADPKSKHTEELKGLLKEYSCFDSREPDEYSQVFHQSGKFAIVFADARSGLDFFKSNSEYLSGLQFKTFLYLPVNGNFNPEAQAKLKEERIHVYPLASRDKLVQGIHEYLNGKDDDFINIEDIQFNMPKDD